MKKILVTFFVLITGVSTLHAQAFSELQCNSIDHKYNRCFSNQPIVRAQLIEQLSHSDCNYGESWGYDRDSVWVNDGCRANFRLQHVQQNQTVTRDIVCQSNGDHDEHQCSFNGAIQQVAILQNYGNCTFGRTWAYNAQYLLVTHGCGGLFRVVYKPSF